MFTSLRGYRRGWLRGDLVAGLTVWAVLVPEALAYASIAGVSPVVGLYAAPGALVLYAAFGSSRHLVVGPMAATAALSAAAGGGGEHTTHPRAPPGSGTGSEGPTHLSPGTRPHVSSPARNTPRQPEAPTTGPMFWQQCSSATSAMR